VGSLVCSATIEQQSIVESVSGERIRGDVHFDAQDPFCKQWG
jgi:hypothetical protein